MAGDVFKLNQKIPASEVRGLLLLNPQQALPGAEVALESQALRDVTACDDLAFDRLCSCSGARTLAAVRSPFGRENYSLVTMLFVGNAPAATIMS